MFNCSEAVSISLSFEYSFGVKSNSFGLPDEGFNQPRAWSEMRTDVW